LKVSLVMCTIGRSDDLRRFLDSLCAQTYTNYEIIIVDQNSDDRLIDIVEKYKKLVYLKYVKSELKGLSKNRNIGLQYVEGDIIAFPDDDCVYPRHTLIRVIEVFSNAEKRVDSISVRFNRLMGEGKEQSEFNDFVWDKTKKMKIITKYNWLRKTCSITMFVKRNIQIQVGIFNENLGLGGALIPAGEDYDYALNILDYGYNMYFIPEIAVLHPVPEINSLNQVDYDTNRHRVELTGKVNMYLSNHYRLGVKFKLFRMLDRMVGFLYRLIQLDMRRCDLILTDIRTMIRYWDLKL